MLPDSHLGATPKKYLIHISVVNWGLRGKQYSKLWIYSHFKMKVRPTKRLDARKYNVNDCVERTCQSFSGPYSSEKKIANAGTETRATRNSRDVGNLNKKRL